MVHYKLLLQKWSITEKLLFSLRTVRGVFELSQSKEVLSLLIAFLSSLVFFINLVVHRVSPQALKKFLIA